MFKLLLIGLNKKALSIEIFNGNFFNTENKKKSVKHSPSFRLVNVTAVVSRKNYLVMTSFFVRVINHFIANKHLSRKSSFTTFLYFGSHHRVVGIQFVSWLLAMADCHLVHLFYRMVSKQYRLDCQNRAGCVQVRNGII